MTNGLHFSAQSSGGTGFRSGFLPVKRIFWSEFCSPLGEDVFLFSNSLKEHVLHEVGGGNLFRSPPPGGSLSPAQLLNNSKRSIGRAALLTPAKDP